MTRVRTLILGGGLAGISAALHAKDDWLLVEKEPALGGLARSRRVEGFTCDLTGHLIHCRTEYGKALIEDLLRGNLIWFARRSAIHFQGRLARYPFQAYLCDLPEAVRDECLSGFRSAAAANAPARDFEAWIRARFGEGIARHFMLPYNRKVWAEPLANLDVDWTENRVPVPTLADVERGAQGTLAKEFGYNATVAYPRVGGMQALTDAMAARIDAARVRTSTRIERLDLATRVARLAGGEEVAFERLVSTVPPSVLAGVTDGVPGEVADAASGLRSNRVTCLSIASPVPLPVHWVYVPDEAVPFYRVGCSSLFSPEVAPPGQHLLYVEVASPAGRPAMTAIPPGLFSHAADLLGVAGGDLRLIDRVELPWAYPLFDLGWRGRFESFRKWFEGRGVRLAGRFGRWAYHSMEEAILDGRDASA